LVKATNLHQHVAANGSRLVKKNEAGREDFGWVQPNSFFNRWVDGRVFKRAHRDTRKLNDAIAYTADDGFTCSLQQRNLALDFSRMPGIVGVLERDDFALREANAVVPSRRRSGVFLNGPADPVA